VHLERAAISPDKRAALYRLPHVLLTGADGPTAFGTPRCAPKEMPANATVRCKHANGVGIPFAVVNVQCAPQKLNRVRM
jgi:hypothetical protein